MKIGDLVEYVEDRSVGSVMRRMNDSDGIHIRGEDISKLWWVQFVDNDNPHWCHENEMYTLQKGK